MQTRKVAGRIIGPRGHFEGASFRGANLEGENLHRSNFQKADLHNANLRNADLSYANFSGANLRDADLRGANLEGASFESFPRIGLFTNLTGANFSGANLTRTNFVDAEIEGAVFEDVIGTYSLKIAEDATWSGRQRNKQITLFLWLGLIGVLVLGLLLWQGFKMIDRSPVNNRSRPFFDVEQEPTCYGDCLDMDGDGLRESDIDGDGDGIYESP